MSTINKKTFFSQFSHFFTGQAAVLLVGLITFPILTRLLSMEQYGILAIVTNTMSMAVAFAKCGLSDGIIRLHSEYEDNIERRAMFSSTLLFGGGFLSLFAVACYLFVLPFLLNSLGVQEAFKISFWIMAAYLFVRPLNIIFLNLLRASGRTKRINIFNLVNKIISVAIGLFLLVYVIKDVYGYFVGNIIGEYVIFAVLLYGFLSNYKTNFSSFSITITRTLIGFGFPLLLSELAYLLLSYGDRYIILYFHGEKYLGLYSVGYNLAMYISGLITFSLSYSIVPLYVKLYATKGKEETEVFLQESCYYLLVVIIPICFGYLAIANDLFVLLASDKYASAAAFSPIILYGSLFLGLNSVLNAGLYIRKKSGAIFSIIFSGVIINIILNMLLVPKFYVMGASWATLISCFITSVLTVFLSFKHLTITIKKDIFYHVFLSVIMYFAIAYIATGSNTLNLALKLLLGAIIVASGVLLREQSLVEQIKKKVF